jgi:hypothetical protein
MPLDSNPLAVEAIREEIGVEDTDGSYSRGDKENQLFKLLKTIKHRVRSENDIVMCTSGPEGSGKSTLAIKLGMELDENYALNPDKWIDENIVVNPDVQQVQDKILHLLPPYSYINIDEGIRIFYKRESFSFENKFLVKLFSISRKCKKIINVCIPDFNDLDTYARKHRVKLWFYVPQRGRAIVFIPWTSPYCIDTWLREENEKLFVKELGKGSIAEYSVEEQINVFRKSRNYVMDFYFDKLPAPIEARYLKNVEELRREMDYNKEKEKEEKTKIGRYQELFYRTRGHFVNLVQILQENNISKSTVAKSLDVSEDYIKDICDANREYLDKLRRKDKTEEIRMM